MNKKQTKNLNDLRNLPAYPIREAARYLGIPVTTLKSWIMGRPYPSGTGMRFFKPIIHIPDKSQNLLSFINLVEAHVLNATRKYHNVPLKNIRRALEYVRENLKSEHPLVDQEFETNGIDLFIEHGCFINASKHGQIAIRDILQAYLHRIERDHAGIPIRLYPFTRKNYSEEPKTVVIDPYISFGRPVLAGTGIPTEIIAERYKAGESIEELSNDYGLQPLQIQEAIRCELPDAA